MERERMYETRYGMRFPKEEVLMEEVVAKEIITKIKNEAPTFKVAKKILEIAGAMLEECKIV